MQHPERALEIEEWEALVARGEVPGPMTVDEYQDLDEAEFGREELLMGWRVHEPVPITLHQIAISNINVLIAMHLMEQSLGIIMAPSGGILLDEEKRILLIPDASVILHDRMHVIKERRMDAPPNLVIEALSPSTSRRDRVNKLEWYGKYGVDEYWIIDVKKKHIDIHDLTAGAGQPPVRFNEPDMIVSRVLPDIRLKVEWVFGPLHQQALLTVFTKHETSEASTPGRSRARPRRR